MKRILISLIIVLPALIIGLVLLYRWPPILLPKPMETGETAIKKPLKTRQIDFKYQYHYNLGVYHITHDMPEVALVEFQKAISLDPAQETAYNGLAIAYMKQVKLGKAIEYYQKALQLNPRFAEAHLGLANAYMAQNNMVKAVEEIDRALKINPGLPEAHYNLGVFYSNEGMMDKAIASFRKALEIKFDYAEAHNNLGSLYQKMGKYGEALAEYKRSLEIDPDNIKTLNNLAYLYAEGDMKLGEALELINKALKNNSRDPVLLDTKAWVYFKTGKYKEALTLIAQALKTSPGDKVLLRHQEIIKEYMKD